MKFRRILSSHITRLLRPRYCTAFALALTAGAAGYSGMVFSQEVPSSVDPGRIERDLSESTSAPTVRPAPDTRGATGYGAKAPAGADEMIFVLKSVNLEGDGTVYAESDLLSGLLSLVGQEVSVAHIFEFAAQMTARYRNDGYLLSKVVVPAQAINGGEIVLRVIEGYLDDVIIDANGLGQEYVDAVSARVSSLVGQRPLARASLERALLLVDDLPGVVVSSYVEPSPKNGGAATLTVKVQKKDADGWVRVDNRGSRFVGPAQLEAGMIYNGLGGSADSSGSIRVITTPSETSELVYLNVGYADELTSDGIGVIGSITGLNSEPGEELAPLDLKSEAYGFSLTARLKPIRERRENLYLSATFDYNNSKTKALDSLLSKDNRRTVRFDVDYQFADRLSGSTSLRLGLSKGISGIGATDEGDPLNTRGDADPDAGWVNVDISRLQDLSGLISGVSMYGAVSMQYADNPLSAAREFGVGGRANASAFDSSEISGDHGASGRLELRYSTALALVDSAGQDGSYSDGVQFYGFVDGGAVWQEEGELSGQDHARISSGGLGLRFNAGQAISGGLEVAKPYGENVAAEGDRDPRVFFELTGRF